MVSMERTWLAAGEDLFPPGAMADATEGALLRAGRLDA
jgi:hypothetical protein